MKQYKWGIIGPGTIAHKFVQALKTNKQAKTTAVLSRSEGRAKAFAQMYSIEKYFSKDIEFVHNSGIDIAYIATPHNFHLPFVKLCLENKINVVCEKPAGINEAEVQTMVSVAKQHNVFFMEAMWTQFFPLMREVLNQINKGIIGEVKLIDAKFCFQGEYNTKSRLLNPHLAGGALLDVGVYTLYFAQMILNKYPVHITGSAHIGDTGVDESSSYILRYDKGEMAVLTSAVRTKTIHDGLIYGTKGYIRIPDFWNPDSFFVNKNGKEQEYRFEHDENGFVYEIEEVHKCLNDGKTESSVITMSKSIEVARIMDKLRKQWGMKYPGEK